MKALLTICFIAAMTSVFAQDVEFSASVSSNMVTTSDKIRLEFHANSNGSIDYPDLSDFNILGGPYQSSQSSFTYINGRMTSKESKTFTLVIQPKKTGTLTIPPAKYKVDGQTYQSNSITLQVSKGTDPQPADSPKQLNPNNELTATMQVSRNNLFQGEALTVVYKVYSRNQFYQLSDFKPGTHNGFFTKEIDLNLRNNTYDVQQENINGVRYFTITLRKELLIPQKAGTLTLDPFEIELMLVQGRGFFSQTFPARAKSNAVSINVKPLPSPPADFNGMVGSLKLETDISRTQIKANEGFDLTVKLSGSGNIQFIDAPKLELPEEFEVYDPEETSNIQINARGMSGNRTYKYFIIPRIHGEFRISPISVSYFDPSSGTYKQVKAAESVLQVERGEGEDQAEIANMSKSADQKEVQAANKARYLSDDHNLQRVNRNPVTSIWFVTGASLPLLALLFLLIARKRMHQTPSEQDVRKRAARKELRQARLLAEQGDAQAAFQSLEIAVNEFIRSRTALQLSGMSKTSIRDAFEKLHVPPELADQLIETLERCEMARYGMSASQQVTDTLNRTEELFHAIEQAIKK